MPSFEPMVTIASASGSNSMSQRRRYHWQMARRKRGMPRETEYPCVSGRCTVSTSLSTMCRGVGPSGLPMPKSMMSSPRRRAAILSSEVMLKTYGGRRWSRANSLCGGEAMRILLRDVSARNRPSDAAGVEPIIVAELAMKFHLSTTQGNVFTGHGEGFIRLGIVEYRENILVTPEQIITGWARGGFDALTEAEFEAIA